MVAIMYGGRWSVIGLRISLQENDRRLINVNASLVLKTNTALSPSATDYTFPDQFLPNLW